MAEPAGLSTFKTCAGLLDTTRNTDERSVPFNSGKIRRPRQSNFLRFNVIGLFHLFFGQKHSQQFSFCWVSF